MRKRILSFVLALVMVLSLVPVGIIPVETAEAADSSLTASEIVAKLQNIKNNEYPDGSSYTGSFGGGSECWAFARLLANKVFGSYPWDCGPYSDGQVVNGWKLVRNPNETTVIEPGDVIEVRNTGTHTAIVWTVNGSSITFAECWGSSGGIVNWGAYNDRYSTLASIITAYGQANVYIWKRPGATNSVETPIISKTYPSYCKVQVTASDAHVKSMPCSESSDPNSVTVAYPEKGHTFTAIELVQNRYGNYWYKVGLAGGKEGYLYAGDGKMTEMLCDVKITGATNPPDIQQGGRYTIQGTISAKYNQLTDVSAYIYAGTDTSGGKELTGGAAAVSNNSYTLANSGIDMVTYFNNLAVGHYTYVVRAAYWNYYAIDGKTLSSNVNSHYSVALQASAFSVTSGHTHSWKVILNTEYHWDECSTCGEQRNVVAHSLTTKNDATYHWKTCTVCCAVVDQVKHTFSAWTVTVKPTYTATGTEKRTCSGCGYAETRTVPKLTLGVPTLSISTAKSCGNPTVTWTAVDGAEQYIVYRRAYEDEAYSELARTTSRSYTDKSSDRVLGTKYYYKVRAIVNGASGAKSDSVKHTYDHADLVNAPAEAPTCTATGLTEGQYCAACGTMTIEPMEVPALGHAYSNGVYTDDVCTRCGTIPGLEYTISGGEVTITGYTGNAAVVELSAKIEGKPVRVIDGSVFGGNNNLEIVAILGNVTTIGNFAFANCENLGAVILPKSITKIDQQAFENCESLCSVYITDLAAWCGIDFWNAYSNPLSQGANLYINETLTSELVIPASVSSIKDFAFFDYDRMTSIYIPEGVTYIGWSAFCDCEGLSSITLPESIRYIDQYAFGYTGLKSVRFLGDAPTFNGETQFGGVTATAYYPCSNATWTEDVMKDYGGNLTWIPAHDYQDGICTGCGDTQIKLSAPAVTATNRASDGKPSLSWEPVSGAAKYEVYRATSKTGTYTKIWTITKTSCTNTSAVAGKGYYYKVRAIDANGVAGPYSEIVNRVCDYAKPVVKATNDPATGKNILSWEAVEGATKYELYRSTSLTGTYEKIWADSKTTVTHSGTPGTTYYYKVRALGSSASATSAFSAIVQRTADYAKPVVKTTNNATSGKVVLSWDAVKGATKYELYRATSKTGTYSKIWTGTTTTVTHSGTPGTTYYYKVRALGSNSNATSAFSAIVQRTCDYARPVVKATNNATTGKVVLSWEAVPGATKYELYRSTSLNGTYSKIWTGTTTSVTHSGTPGTTYYYKVRALGSNANATSAFSAIVQRTADYAKPVVTVKLNSSGKPVLTWKAVSGATKYEVYRSTSENGTYTKIWGSSATTCTHTGAVSGTTYYYKVRALGSNTNATSAYSSVVSVKCK